jgi:predicted ArsR family transcriptional regulator
MGKSKFLLVDLNEKRTKKLANVITSDTSRKILSHLAEKDDSEAKIAEQLKIPISTVHYHLQKLQEASLVSVEEFHYSPKGREVNHYKLANKYIIIAPKKVSGLRQKLKDILPVGVIALGISAVIKFLQERTTTFSGSIEKVAQVAVESVDVASNTAEQTTAILVEETTAGVAGEIASNTAEQTAAALTQETTIQAAQSSPDIALWFLIGSVVTIAIYLIIIWIRRKK